MRVLMSAVALALCACGREPSFNERFSRSENEIEERARELDEQLNGAEASDASASGAKLQPD